MYPDMQVQNKTLHRLVTTIRDTGSVCGRQHVRRPTVLAGGTLRDVDATLARPPREIFWKTVTANWIISDICCKPSVLTPPTARQEECT
jgi:hypothetical protein